MRIEFKLYRLGQDSSLLNMLKRATTKSVVNEFIAIGLDEDLTSDYVKVLNVGDGNINVLPSSDLDSLAYRVPKEELLNYASSPSSIFSVEFDIPNECLTDEVMRGIEQFN